MRSGILITALALAASPARADVTSIRPDPSPFPGDNSCMCTAPDDGSAPTVVGWKWTCQATHGTASWPVNIGQAGPGAALFATPIPADFKVSCRVSYQGRPGMPAPAPKDLPAITIHVGPPDGLRIIDGDAATITFPDPLIVTSEILQKGQPVGWYLVGLPQESLHGQNWDGRDLDPRWFPATGPTPTFDLVRGTIVDTQTADLSESGWAWPLIVVGANLDWSQDIRIRFTYADSSTLVAPLGTIYNSWEKINDTQWISAAIVGP